MCQEARREVEVVGARTVTISQLLDSAWTSPWDSYGACACPVCGHAQWICGGRCIHADGIAKGSDRGRGSVKEYQNLPINPRRPREIN